MAKDTLEDRVAKGHFKFAEVDFMVGSVWHWRLGGSGGLDRIIEVRSIVDEAVVVYKSSNDHYGCETLEFLRYAYTVGNLTRRVCHICGDDTGKHDPDCTSFLQGIDTTFK